MSRSAPLRTPGWLALCVLALACPLSFGQAQKPKPHTISRAAPGNHYTKASSLAPRAHSKTRVYGAPIPRAIATTRAPAKPKPKPPLPIQ